MSADSVIGAGSIVRGNVRGEGALEIFGRVEGDVSVSGDVLVGENGAVRGNISAGRISVLGAVQGDLRGSEAVLIEPGGKVAGDLSAPRIGIANGGLVRGNVRTEGEPALQTARRSAAAVRPAVFAPKPVAKAEPKPALVAVEPESEPPHAPPPQRETRERPAERRPPPPVVPALGKGAKAKRKPSRE
jgi:cytoskeletal protein CcmA (bactofilin family)